LPLAASKYRIPIFYDDETHQGKDRTGQPGVSELASLRDANGGQGTRLNVRLWGERTAPYFGSGFLGSFAIRVRQAARRRGEELGKEPGDVVGSVLN